jgi:hypothetical protein
MNRENSELVGDRVEEFMEVAGVEDGLAVGKCLRIKVRKSLDEPLMRETMLEVDKKGKTIWCLM